MVGLARTFRYRAWTLTLTVENPEKTNDRVAEIDLAPKTSGADA